MLCDGCKDYHQCQKTCKEVESYLKSELKQGSSPGIVFVSPEYLDYLSMERAYKLKFGHKVVSKAVYNPYEPQELYG